MKSILKIASLVFVVLIANACNTSLIKKDMMSFDQAFIPAFYYAYVGDLKKTRIAMYPLHQNWQQFKQKYRTETDLCADWNESLEMIESWLLETDAALLDGDIRRALFQLDHARYEMSDLRWRADIDYYLDYVWDLEGSIGEAVDVATDPMLNLMSWKEFFSLSTTVVEAWETLKKQTLDADQFGFSSSDILALKEQQQVVDETIAQFLKAVDSADMCEFEEAAMALEPAYLNMLVVFGDFEKVQTYYAHRK